MQRSFVIPKKESKRGKIIHCFTLFFFLLHRKDTSHRLVFVRFLEEIEDTKKPFRNYLTFMKLSFSSNVTV